MAAKGQQKYSSFADVSALKKEQKQVEAIFDSLLKKHKQVSNLQLNIGSGKSIKAVTDAEICSCF